MTWRHKIREAKARLGTLGRNEKGSITVETALIMLVIIFMALGVLDYGLAYSRNLELANAVRAGMQYALVRKPVDGDYSAIISAVNTAAPVVTAGSDRQVTANMFCACPDGSSIDCTGTNGQDLTCTDGSLRGAYLEIKLKETYAMLFAYPGLDKSLNLSERVVVRLN
ncbi:TadE/TadG family type IV pilus assembly protein [Kordiimonas marina]|uniref:TadE/TadG family type IV pilus assembly protein n=1 Tax=Kordiimonas marina TaxID=2872312 RepID=UPI001FF3F966|nr:TadE/TadG family type IV pilus assembly protein [Kordiimonas marina]MCJ9428595.1 pilus assembly protein [Kordiimonas marina]